MLRCQPPREMIAGSSLEEHHIAADEASTVIGDCLHRLLHQRRTGRDPRDDGVHQHPGADAGIDQLANCTQALQRRGRSRFELTPDVLVEAWDADVYAATTAC